jgi:hypothetical protein
LVRRKNLLTLIDRKVKMTPKLRGDTHSPNCSALSYIYVAISVIEKKNLCWKLRTSPPPPLDWRRGSVVATPVDFWTRRFLWLSQRISFLGQPMHITLYPSIKRACFVLEFNVYKFWVMLDILNTVYTPRVSSVSSLYCHYMFRPSWAIIRWLKYTYNYWNRSHLKTNEDASTLVLLYSFSCPPLSHTQLVQE